MIKKSTPQEEITIVNTYVPNIGAPKLKQILTELKENVNSNTVIVGDFNTPLSTMDTSGKESISKQ